MNCYVWAFHLTESTIQRRSFLRSDKLETSVVAEVGIILRNRNRPTWLQTRLISGATIKTTLHLLRLKNSCNRDEMLSLSNSWTQNHSWHKCHNCKLCPQNLKVRGGKAIIRQNLAKVPPSTRTVCKCRSLMSYTKWANNMYTCTFYFVNNRGRQLSLIHIWRCRRRG